MTTQPQVKQETNLVSKLVLLEMDKTVPFNAIMGEEDSKQVYIDALDIVATPDEISTLKVGQHITLHIDTTVAYRDGGERRLDRYLNGKHGTIIEILDYEQ